MLCKLLKGRILLVFLLYQSLIIALDFFHIRPLLCKSQFSVIFCTIIMWNMVILHYLLFFE